MGGELGDSNHGDSGSGDNTGSNRPPAAKLSIRPNPSEYDNRVEFDATASYDPDGTIENYLFDFNNDGVYDASNTNGIAHRYYDQSGSHTVRLKVEDNDAAESTAVRTFSIENSAETCDITSGLLDLEKSYIEEGESTTAQVNLYNDGAEQKVRVTFKVDDVIVSESTKTLLKDENAEFTAEVSPEEDSEVRVFVDLVDGPCGDQEIYQSSRYLYVDSQPEPAELTVIAVDQKGETVENTRIAVKNGERDLKYTGSNGQTEFTLNPGTYDIEATKDRYTNAKEYVQLREGEDRTLKLILGDRDANASLTVRAEDNDGDPIRNARVTVQNGERAVKYTDSDGEVGYSLNPGEKEVTVREEGYRIKQRTIDLGPGQDRTEVFELREKTTEDPDQGLLRVCVRDEDIQQVEDARVRVENGDTETGYTDSNGCTEFSLEPDDYTVRVSKQYYSTSNQTIDLDEGDYRTLNFYLQKRDEPGNGDGPGDNQSFTIERLRFQQNVCRGEDLSAEITIRNGDRSQPLAVGARLGDSKDTQQNQYSRAETRTVRLNLDNVQGSGRETLRIAITNGRQFTESRTVTVENCSDNGNGDNDDGNQQNPTAISMDIAPPRVQVGDTFRVSGYVDGIEGRTNVQVFVEGNRKADISTEPDGYYETFIQAKKVGSRTVRVESGNRVSTREITVLPTVSVTSMEAPRQVFENDRFEICANVESQVTPLVVLRKDGEKIQSKNAEGEVCFNTQSTDPGTHEYAIIASARGIQSTKTRTVDVQEISNEVENFPDKVAMIRSGDGIIRVRLYNTHETTKRYNLEMRGLRNDWVSATDKSVILNSGERQSVYFYITPEAEGKFEPLLTVSTDSEGRIYSQEILVSSGGTLKSRKPWYGELMQLLSF
jgi:hypothetical protein